MTKREEIFSKLENVPSFPSSAGRVLDLIQKPDVDFQEVVKLIEYDPLLTTNILRLANSAYYRGLAKIETVRDAVLRLGLDNIFNMVVAIGFAPIAQKTVDPYDLTAGSFFEHSVAVAIGSVHLAKMLRLKVPPYLFTAALLHDIGKVVLGTYAGVDGEEIRKVCQKEGVQFEVAERKVLGTDHAEVGAALLRLWNMPENIVSVVEFHHGGVPLENGLAPHMVHLANSFCLMSGVGGEREGVDNLPSYEILSHYRMGDMVSAKLVESIEGELESALSLFRGV